MKKLFLFLRKITAFIALFCVTIYCIGYFFASKTRKINELFTSKEAPDETEE